MSQTPSVQLGKTRIHVRSIVGWAVSILCLGLIAWNVDLAGAAAAMRDFAWPFVLLALVGLSFGYAMRIIRWAVMLRATETAVRTGDCAAPFLGSIALNNVLPLRAGDIVRGTVFPAAIGVPRTTAISSIVMERLLDLLTLVLFLTVGTSVLRGARLPDWLVEGTIVLAIIGAISLLAIFLFSGAIARMLLGQAGRRPEGDIVGKGLRVAAEFLDGFRHMSAPRALGAVFALSILVWLGESAAFYFVMAGFGIEQPPIAALLVMAFVTLSTLVPSSPGYVGPFHLAAFSVMILLGVSEEVATSFAVLSHLMVWVPTTVAGGIAMLARPEIFRTARSVQARAAQERDTHDIPTV
ncbi:lysylphosphatidylglycerol synthase transmembrane domain-containing protein [Aliihoeflea sp. 40Bstr573]|uniref:lysylphosphatidylglycerol synthase transmembrane domain-containing protein n=1 Tax=Aliihoeflea sp. 40Bstr573 TaxID=2696467 RepID=UPI0020942FD7|nr:lysylphosphatidylglycerol synthase transmembrane domain-containing protein [Aliihoeflea sp. 40Bstr573]MCO6387501.1 flippase-like domain-containing protein [Aliihoeflea sp. 40Bstr573]